MGPKIKKNDPRFHAIKDHLQGKSVFTHGVATSGVIRYFTDIMCTIMYTPDLQDVPSDAQWDEDERCAAHTLIDGRCIAADLRKLALQTPQTPNLGPMKGNMAFMVDPACPP
jgi:hypothetical protein